MELAEIKRNRSANPIVHLAMPRAKVA
jgi:hypothetical protein